MKALGLLLVALLALFVTVRGGCDKKRGGGKCEDNDDCNHHGSCIQQSCHCQCTGGYTGNFCEQRDPCYWQHCNGHGTCQRVDNDHFDCTCHDGYNGLLCENRISCYGQTCNSHGTCHQVDANNDQCTCNDGYVGQYCENHDPCFGQNCSGHGTCNPVDKDNYNCTCHGGYDGQHCENYHPCYNNNCSSHGQCHEIAHIHPYCECDVGYTGLSCESMTTTTTSTTTTTTTPTPTTTSQITYIRCEQLDTITALGTKTPVNNTNVDSCPNSASFATPEAFVIDHCHVPSPANWTQGVNVMKDCQSVPLYTPVATFQNNQYVTAGALSGIFLGCLPNGFKLGAQECYSLPEILHIEGGLSTKNPNLYYTIQ